MSKYEQIHETVVRDICDIVVDAKDGFDLFQTGKSFKSINTATSGLILVFPVLCSSTIQMANAAMVSKAIERRATSLLQMLFSAISITNAKDAMEYVKQVHTNLYIDDHMTIDSFIDAIDKYVVSANESAIIDKTMYESVRADLKNLNYFLASSISESSLNDFKITSINGSRRVLQEKRGDDRVDLNKTASEMFSKQLLDSDVKKANELQPTQMVIHFTSCGMEGDPVNTSAVIGVKAKLYPIDSMDIINRIKLKNQDNNGFNKFLRASTREISFWKDFVFAIDKAKIDAISNSKRGSSSKFWKVLERRALKSKLRRSLRGTNDATAITTLVISGEEVEYLKKMENIDISKESVMRPIMESYNLMSVVIVDESMENAKFLFDTADDIYETVSFNHLEREASDNNYKKVVNLMTKLSR